MTTRRQWLALVAAFGLLQGAIAVGSVVLPALSGDVGLEGIYFDVRVYHEHARKAVTRVPYRDYVVEYPLLAFPIFYAPILITRDPTLFARLIGAEMLLANLACLGLVARHVGASAPARVVAGRLTWYTLAFAGLCPMLLARFDLVPTALAFAAALGWFGRRPILGGTLAALGALVKIFPALIAAPALLLALRRPRLLRGHVAFALVLALGVFCWWSLGGDRVLRSIQFQTGRGLEVGSTYAGLLVPLGWLTGRPTAPTFDNNAMHLASPWSSRVASLVLPIQALALLLILALSSIRRRRPTDPFLLTCSLLVAPDRHRQGPLPPVPHLAPPLPPLP